MNLIALREFSYATRRLMPGEPFTASDRDGRLLVAIKKARPVREVGKIAPPPPTLVEKVSDVQGLRAEYQRVTGKRPFMGWTPEILREKIAAA